MDVGLPLQRNVIHVYILGLPYTKNKLINKNRSERVTVFATVVYCEFNNNQLLCDTDTTNMLHFLRSSKFSQLRARTMVENHVRAFGSFPQWFRDVDTHDPDLIEAIESG